MRRLGAVLAAVFIIVISACRSTPEVPSLQLNDDSSALQAAILAVKAVPDPFTQAVVHIRVAEAYGAHAQTPEMAEDALATAAQARELLSRAGVSVGSTAALLDLARVYLQLEQPGVAHQLVGEAIGRFQSDDRPVLLVNLLVEAVAVGLAGGEATRDLVREAINEIYVVEDPGQRGHALVRIAEIYQEQAVGQPVTGLIQQAMPAFRSVENPWERAVGFSRVAVRHARANNADAADRAAQDTVAQVHDQPAPEAENRARQRSLVGNLVDAGAFSYAQAVMDDEQRPGPRSALLVELASGHRAAGRGADAAVALAEAHTRALQVESGAERVDLLSSIAQAYLQLPIRNLAFAVAEEAMVAINEDARSVDRLEALERLGRVYAELDEVDLLREYLSTLPTMYARGMVALAAAQPLITAQLRGVADDLLVFAFLQVDGEAYLRDTLLRSIAAGFSENRSFVFSMRATDRIDDPYLQALALADLGAEILAAGGLSPNEQSLLDQIIAEL